MYIDECKLAHISCWECTTNIHKPMYTLLGVEEMHTLHLHSMIPGSLQKSQPSQWMAVKLKKTQTHFERKCPCWICILSDALDLGERVCEDLVHTALVRKLSKTQTRTTRFSYLRNVLRNITQRIDINYRCNVDTG